MPPVRDQAICIRSWEFSETSQTVSLFTREHGVIRGLAKGARRAKGQFSGGLDVLTRGEVVAILKPGLDLATLTAWHILEIYPAVRKDLIANRAGLYMADLVHCMVIEHDPHPTLFDAFTESLAALSERASVEATLLRWQWTVLKETGYQPVLEPDQETGRAPASGAKFLAFSPSAGGVVADPDSIRDSWQVSRETIEVLRRVARNEKPDRAHTEYVRRANRLLAAYIREVIGREPTAMRWAFGELTVVPARPGSDAR